MYQPISIEYIQRHTRIRLCYQSLAVQRQQRMALEAPRQLPFAAISRMEVRAPIDSSWHEHELLPKQDLEYFVLRRCLPPCFTRAYVDKARLLNGCPGPEKVAGAEGVSFTQHVKTMNGLYLERKADLKPRYSLCIYRDHCGLGWSSHCPPCQSCSSQRIISLATTFTRRFHFGLLPLVRLYQSRAITWP